MSWFTKKPRPESDIVAGVRALAADKSRWTLWINDEVRHSPTTVRLCHNGMILSSGAWSCTKLPRRDRAILRAIYAQLFRAICERAATQPQEPAR